MRFHPNVQLTFWLITVLILSFTGPSLAEEQAVRFEAIRLDSAALVVDVVFEHVLDRQVVQGLRKGMTALLIYDAQIWKEGFLWNKSLITERQRRFKVHFDTWERQFIITPREGEQRTMDEKALMEYCNTLNSFHLTEKSRLDSGAVYRIWMSVMIKPMSVENLEEIKHWLVGEAGDFDPNDIKITKSPLSRMGDWFLHMVVNVTGFGDRVYSGKSPEISIFNQTMIIRDE